MKITYEVQPGCVLEHDAAGTKQAFALISYWTTVFGVKKCGQCGSPNVRMDYRKPQGYEYFQYQCQDCKYELKFGQKQETGELFPKGWDPPYQKDRVSQSDGPEPTYHHQQPASPPQASEPPPDSSYDIPF